MKKLLLIAIFSLIAAFWTFIFSGRHAIAVGADIYKADCETCHGEKGDGKGPMAKELKHSPPDFTNKAKMIKKSDKKLIELVKKGKHQMPPFDGVLKDEEIKEVVTYIRQFAK